MPPWSSAEQADGLIARRVGRKVAGGEVAVGDEGHRRRNQLPRFEMRGSIPDAICVRRRECVRSVEEWVWELKSNVGWLGRWMSVHVWTEPSGMG